MRLGVNVIAKDSGRANVKSYLFLLPLSAQIYVSAVVIVGLLVSVEDAPSAPLRFAFGGKINIITCFWF